jgi:hypothetical protein
VRGFWRRFWRRLGDTQVGFGVRVTLLVESGFSCLWPRAVLPVALPAPVIPKKPGSCPEFHQPVSISNSSSVTKLIRFTHIHGGISNFEKHRPR